MNEANQTEARAACTCSANGERGMRHEIGCPAGPNLCRNCGVLLNHHGIYCSIGCANAKPGPTHPSQIAESAQPKRPANPARWLWICGCNHTHEGEVPNCGACGTARPIATVLPDEQPIGVPLPGPIPDPPDPPAKPDPKAMGLPKSVIDADMGKAVWTWRCPCGCLNEDVVDQCDSCKRNAPAPPLPAALITGIIDAEKEKQAAKIKRASKLAADPPSAAPPGGTWLCGCGEPNDPDRAFCGSCSASQRDRQLGCWDERLQNRLSPGSLSTWKCPACGYEANTRTTCSGCGGKLEAMPAANNPANNSQQDDNPPSPAGVRLWSAITYALNRCGCEGAPARSHRVGCYVPELQGAVDDIHIDLLAGELTDAAEADPVLAAKIAPDVPALMRKIRGLVKHRVGCDSGRADRRFVCSCGMSDMLLQLDTALQLGVTVDRATRSAADGPRGKGGA